jgi:hypothetical protein
LVKMLRRQRMLHVFLRISPLFIYLCAETMVVNVLLATLILSDVESFICIGVFPFNIPFHIHVFYGPFSEMSDFRLLVAMKRPLFEIYTKCCFLTADSCCILCV